MNLARIDKVIVIDDCRSELLDNLDGLAYSRLSGEGALVIHTEDLAVTPGERATQENIQKVIDIIKVIGGAQIRVNDTTSIPDAFILLRR